MSPVMLLAAVLAAGRRDWDRLHRDARIIKLADAGVKVASAADAWALRRASKDS